MIHQPRLGRSAQRGVAYLMDIVVASALGVAMLVFAVSQSAASQRNGDLDLAITDCSAIADYGNVFWRTIASSSQDPTTHVYSYTYNYTPPFQVPVSQFATNRALPNVSPYGSNYSFGVVTGGQTAYCAFNLPAGIFSGTPKSSLPGVSVSSDGAGGWNFIVSAVPNQSFGAQSFVLDQLRSVKNNFYLETPR